MSIVLCAGASTVAHRFSLRNCCFGGVNVSIKLTSLLGNRARILENDGIELLRAPAHGREAYVSEECAHKIGAHFHNAHRAMIDQQTHASHDQFEARA